MMSKPNEWAREFQDFLSVQEVTPPKHLTEKIASEINADLNPSAWIVFSKLALLHAVVGTVTLLFCPQFGISLFGGMGLMGLFMKYGEHACMLGCGAVFLGGSALAASLVLRVEEVRVLRRKELLQISSLGLLSIGAFVCKGSEVVLELLVFWLMGSILGGLLTFEVGWRIRLLIQRV